MAFRTNRYFNDPTIAAAVSNLAQIFGGSAQDDAATAAAGLTGAKADQERLKTDTLRNLSGLFTAYGTDRNPRSAADLAAALTIGGDADKIGAANLGFSAMLPGDATGADLGRAQVGAGRGFDDTAAGFREGQATEMDKAHLAANTSLQEALLKPVSVGANDTVYVSPAQRGVLGIEGENPLVGVLQTAKGATTTTPDGRTVYGQLPQTEGALASLFEGESVEAQDSNILLRGAQDPAYKQTPAYQLAYSRRFGAPARFAEVENADGSKTLQPVYQQPPAAFNLPGGGVQGDGIPARPDTGGLPPAGTGVSAIQTGMVPGSGISLGGVGKPPTEFQAKAAGFAARMKAGEDVIQRLASQGYTKPSLVSYKLRDSLGGLGNYALSDQDTQFNTGVEQFLNPILRGDSGAAVPFEEYPRYYGQFIPMPWDDPETIGLKGRARAIAGAAMSQAAGRAGLTDSQLSALGLNTAIDAVGDLTVTSQAPQLRSTTPTGGIAAPQQAPPMPQQEASPVPSAGPQPGTVEMGYRFKGGNPADAANWERAP